MAKKPKSKVQLITDIAIYAAVAVIVFFTVVFLSLTISAKQGTEIPTVFGAGILEVESDSMKPLFKKGDLIRVRKINEEEAKTLKVDDIITFEFSKDGELAFNTHRIIEVIEHQNGLVSYITQGDANGSPDQDKTLGDLGVGIQDIKAVYIKNVGGVTTGFLKFIRSFAGFLVLILLPLLIFAGYRVYVLIKIVMEIRKEKKAASQPEDLNEVLKQLEEVKAQLEAAKQAASEDRKQS